MVVNSITNGIEMLITQLFQICWTEIYSRPMPRGMVTKRFPGIIKYEYTRDLLLFSKVIISFFIRAYIIISWANLKDSVFCFVLMPLVRSEYSIKSRLFATYIQRRHTHARNIKSTRCLVHIDS